jgi:hypothetical protein
MHALEFFCSARARSRRKSFLFSSSGSKRSLPVSVRSAIARFRKRTEAEYVPKKRKIRRKGRIFVLADGETRFA